MASHEYEILYKKLMEAGPPSSKNTVEEIRVAFERLFSEYAPEPDIRFEPFSIGQIPACWAFAPGVSRQRIVLFFHGGGYRAGSIRSHRDMMGRISRSSGCAVLGIGYRLAPEHPYPAALEDALTAYRWLLHHPYPPSHIAIVGSSAGGGLAFSLSLRLKLEKVSLPAAIVAICPWVDLAMTSPSYEKKEDFLRPVSLKVAAKMYAGEKDLKDPFISPLYGDLKGLPPLLIQVGTREVLFDEVVAFSQKAKKSGVAVTLEKWPEMIHAWHVFAEKIPEGREAIEQIGTFLKKSFQRE